MKTTRQRRRIALMTVIVLVVCLLLSACTSAKKYTFADAALDVPNSFSITEYEEKNPVLISSGKENYKTAVFLHQIEAASKALAFSPDEYAFSEAILDENRKNAITTNLTVEDEKVETSIFCDIPAAYAQVTGTHTGNQTKQTIESWKFLYKNTVYMVSVIREEGASDQELKELQKMVDSITMTK